MKHALISRQRYDLYVKYNGPDSEISGLHGDCGMIRQIWAMVVKNEVYRDPALASAA